MNSANHVLYFGIVRVGTAMLFMRSLNSVGVAGHDDDSASIFLLSQ